MPSESASRRPPKHPFKRQRSNDLGSPSTKSASVNQLKSKIRDLTRALEHSEHLPAGVRIEKERALAGYKQDVEEIRKDKRKNELIKKYHMVRFFERKKATRAHKQLKKRLDASSPDTSEYKQLEQELHDAEIDVNYTIYHPLIEKYRSLFPRQEDGETAARKLVTVKPAIWKMVEQCTEDGTLEALRDGKLVTGLSAKEKKSPPEKTRPTRKGGNGLTGSKPAKDVAPLPQEGEESDGGFFEE
ncbi:hypothetical protein BDR22DRAFT_803841 [Usnea florida]